MSTHKFSGLIAATYTPLDQRGEVQVDAVGPIVEFLLDRGIDGLYVCGSTGEGMSLATHERMQVVDAYIRASDGRLPVVVQVGHNSLADARALAAHAQQSGAAAVSATCPSYYPVSDVATLIACMAEVAAGAPELPFYYYHIPALTGSTIDMREFLRQAGQQIPNLAGLKYTDTQLHEFQSCLQIDGGRFDVLWGCDEMLLGAIATGASAAIGSTYNVAAPLYRQIIAAVGQGDLEGARAAQARAVELIRILKQYPFHPAMKAVLEMLGLTLGGCRLPMGSISSSDRAALGEALRAIGFFDWSAPH